MKDQRLEIKDIVKHIDDAILGKLDIPEFQRGFVWSPEKVKNLVDSLWRVYPIGTILLWESKYGSPKFAQGTQVQKLWVVDGQQRITALSLLFGKKPYWWPDSSEWNQAYEKYDVLVNIRKPKDSLEFGLPNPIRRKSSEWISVRDILTSDNMSRLAQEVCKQTEQEFGEVHEKLQSLRKIDDYPLYEIIIDHEIEDVAEIFTRLNMAGVKIRESDVIIALVAAKQEGWVRKEFNPFLKNLEEKGFELDPAVLIRSLAIVGKGTGRLKDIPSNFWEDTPEFQHSWSKTKTSISYVIRQMNQVGILSSDILPSHNAIIPMFALHSKFSGYFNFGKALYWFLLATGDGRYSGSAITTLDQDIKTISQSANFSDAIDALARPLRIADSFTKSDFLKSYHDDFMRLVLYLLIFGRQAKDWVNQDIRIGYDRSDNELNEGFKPEWHHFFPRKILKDRNIPQSQIDALANIAILNDKANRKFRALPPKVYLAENGVKMERLDEQTIPYEGQYLEDYETFLDSRAEALAFDATKYLAQLKAH